MAKQVTAVEVTRFFSSKRASMWVRDTESVKCAVKSVVREDLRSGEKIEGWKTKERERERQLVSESRRCG